MMLVSDQILVLGLACRINCLMHGSPTSFHQSSTKPRKSQNLRTIKVAALVSVPLSITSSHASTYGVDIRLHRVLP